jgi:hypothetical protein
MSYSVSLHLSLPMPLCCEVLMEPMQFIPPLIPINYNIRARVEEAKEELHKLLTENHLKGIPVLIYANKQDLPHSLTLAEVLTNKSKERGREREGRVRGVGE